MIKKALPILLIGAPLAFLVIFSLILQVTVLSNPEKFTSWLSDFGPFVILVYVILQAVTVIIAPIGGGSLQIAMIALFKPAIALTIIYLVVTPLYLVNFYIARKYGRPLVARIVGKKALNQIDHLAKDAGVITLIVLKVFNVGIFDYLSYAIGLTQFSFKTFAIVNFLGGIPSVFVSYYILTRFDNLIIGVLVLMIIAYVLGMSVIYLNHQVKKHRRI